MKNKKVEITNLLSIVFISLCILPFSFYFDNYSLTYGFIYGGVLGIVNYELIVYSVSAPLIKGIKKRLALFKLIRYALIGGSFALAIFVSSVFNVFTMLAGILVNKVSIIIYELVISKRIGGEVNE